MNRPIDTTLSLMREAINYTSINHYKTLLNKGRKRGQKLTIVDFLALASNNDPFYADSPRGVTWGKWFTEQWQEHKGSQWMIHVRGLHYVLVGRTSSGSPIYMPDGMIYENTLNCWKKLEMAGKYARYNQFIDPERFEDRRAQSLYERIYKDPQMALHLTYPGIYFSFPDFPPLPEYALTYKNRQRYRLEVWCEKSTQEMILEPIVDKYHVTMLSAQGELSISAILKAIARVEKSNMPTRILYISDFDPAGRSMPVAASRKLEFLQSLKHSKAEMQLYPIALTHEQCVSYQLERTPIKESERRKAQFEARYGGGATELDALEAKHPGELANLLEQEILTCYDETLEQRTEQERTRLQSDLIKTQDAVYKQYQDEQEALHQKYERLRSEFQEWVNSRFQPFTDELEALHQTMRKDLLMSQPDLNTYALPSPKIAPTGDHCLYESNRDYLQQLAAYRTFTGKFAHLIEDEEKGEEGESSR